MKKVIIIGAGPAGLTAAYELLKRSKDYEVVVLEASDRTGGISQTVRYHGNRMDIGGHRFFSKDDRVMRWWNDIMPVQGAPAIDDAILHREKDWAKGGPDPQENDTVMLIRDRVSRIYYQYHFFDYPVSLSWSTIKNMGFVTTMKAGFSYLKTCFHKLPETSLENFYINRFGRVLYSMFFEGYTEKLWGRHPSEISADWGAQRVKGLSISAIIKDIFRKILPGKNKGEVETSLIERFWYPKYGPGQLWETVADKITQMGGKLLYDCPVTGFVLENGKLTGVRCNYKGEEKTANADIIISSMPVKDLIEDIDDPQMPQLVHESAADLPYRDFVTVGFLCKKLNLKNKTKHQTLGNIVPDCWIYVQDTNVKLGRIQIFNNWSPYMVENPEEYVWIGLEYFCRENDAFWSMDDELAIDFAKKELIKMGIIDEGDIVDAHRERVKKAYPAYFDGYAHMDAIIDYLNGFQNLYCVGRNGQHRYNNMDHSMVTAFETVDNILSGREDKQNIWNVNTEKSYHEEK